MLWLHDVKLYFSALFLFGKKLMTPNISFAAWKPWPDVVYWFTIYFKSFNLLFQGAHIPISMSVQILFLWHDKLSMYVCVSLYIFYFLFLFNCQGVSLITLFSYYQPFHDNYMKWQCFTQISLVFMLNRLTNKKFVRYNSSTLHDIFLAPRNMVIQLNNVVFACFLREWLFRHPRAPPSGMLMLFGTFYMFSNF